MMSAQLRSVHNDFIEFFVLDGIFATIVPLSHADKHLNHVPILNNKLLNSFLGSNFNICYPTEQVSLSITTAKVIQLKSTKPICNVRPREQRTWKEASTTTTTTATAAERLLSCRSTTYLTYLLPYKFCCRLGLFHPPVPGFRLLPVMFSTIVRGLATEFWFGMG